jgi:hypothetical protein
MLPAVKPTSRAQRNDAYGADSGPSRGDACRRAIRPTATSEAVVCYVRNTSTPAVLSAQIPGIRRRLGERVNRPLADRQDWPSGRVVGAGRRSSAEGIGCAASGRSLNATDRSSLDVRL